MSASAQAVAARVRAKAECEKLIYQTQLLLMDGAVDAHVLETAADILQPQQYADIVEERATEGLCGYPSCDKAAPNRGQGPQKFVSLSQRKVCA